MTSGSSRKQKVRFFLVIETSPVFYRENKSTHLFNRLKYGMPLLLSWLNEFWKLPLFFGNKSFCRFGDCVPKYVKSGELGV
jgi:hypothetical protein